jgi:phosphoenolpyruvate--protein phosphotransferase (EC 2.7.3.9)
VSLKNGDIIIFDGSTGEVFVNPEEDIVREYALKKEEYEDSLRRLRELVDKDTVTKSGRSVQLGANIGTPEDLEVVLNNGAEGVGLFRTEFLFMDRDKAPSEEEQFEAYKSVALGMEGKPVIIRTLDVGGDKQIDYLNLPKEMNPFLGYRAIRLCLDKVELFKAQLRAILRASTFGNIKVMFPMISSVEEVLSAKRILKEVSEELNDNEIAYDKELEVGIMVEIPAAAIISDLLAAEVDFFSIGTNDLIQYTTAVDRMNEKVAHLYNPNNPAVLRLVKMVIENAHAHGKWVGMCGEMAGDPEFIPALIDMGIDELSMAPSSILKARSIIRNME